MKDLSAYSDMLLSHNPEFEFELNILTNKRALTVDNLTQLARLPLPYKIYEWTEELEKKLLNDSFAVFIPVNAQGFSIVKSMNRAVTALASGTQVLTVGYPLYSKVDMFLYHDISSLVIDVKKGRMKVSEDSLMELQDGFESFANPKLEADKFIKFLERLPDTKKNISDRTISLIHGMQTSGDTHKLVQRFKGLSVGTPFSINKLNYDILFMFNSSNNKFVFLISEKKAKLLGENIIIQPFGKINAIMYSSINIKLLSLSIYSQTSKLSPFTSIFESVAYYPYMMTIIRKLLQLVFSDRECIISELSKGAWWLVDSDKTDVVST